MRILLIDPKGANQGINIGLGYIGAILRQRGHEDKAVDFNNYREHQKERLIAALH